MVIYNVGHRRNEGLIEAITTTKQNIKSSHSQ